MNVSCSVCNPKKTQSWLNYDTEVYIVENLRLYTFLCDK